MSLPGISDNDDEMLRLLRQIAENTRDLDAEQNLTLEGDNVEERIGLIPQRTIGITETQNLPDDKTTSDGAVKLSPGDERTLCEFRGGPHALLATGATDRANLIYRVEIDGKLAVGPSFGPLGTVNSPFSFVQQYGGGIPAKSSSRLIARYPDSGGGDVEVVGRNHIEVIQQQ